MKIAILTCDCCAKEFEALRSDARFCSGACKQKAYNRKVKQTILKYGNNCSAQERQRIDRIAAIEMRIEQLQKERSIAPAPASEDISKSMAEFFSKMKRDDENRKVEDANQRLKESLKEILEYSQQGEISRWRLISLFNSIEIKLGTRIYTMPENYKYNIFINETLLPKIASLERGLKNQKERYSALVLSESLEKQIRQILYELI